MPQPSTWENAYKNIHGTYSPDYKPDTTPTDLYAGLVPQQTEADIYAKQLAEESKTAGGQVIDENKIRQDMTARFQSEIDALNRVYAEKRREETIRGIGRLGEVGAIGARRGLLGSDFGASQETAQVSENVAAQNAIEAERMRAESAILSKIEGMVAQETGKRETAKAAGSKDYLAYLRGEDTAKQENVSKTITNILSSKVEPSDTLYTEVSKRLGVTPELLKAEYQNQKANQEAAGLAAQTEAEKAAAELAYKQAQTGEILGKPAAEAAKNVAEQLKTAIAQGFEYVSTPAERDRLKSLGYSTQEINGKTYMKKPETEKPITQTVGKSLLQYDAKTGGWTNIYTAPDTVQDVKDLSVNEKISLAEKGYTIGADGEPVKITTPDAQKIEKAKNLLSSIEDLQSMDWGVAVGPLSSNLPSWMSGKVNAVRAKIDNVRSMLTLENMGLMKGVLSDADMKVITAASTALNASTDEASFDRELLKIKAVAQKAIRASAENASPQQGSTREQLQQEFPQATPKEIEDLYREEQQSFSKVDGDTKKAVASIKAIPENSQGGQCGRFVNQLTSLGVGDSYQSKMAKMDPKIKKAGPGMVFTMPYKDTGHVGIILSVNDGVATVKDSNYYNNSAPEKVKTHEIPVSKMTGFRMI
jgi:hypothetical protein